MILYFDTEKECFSMEDYKSLPEGLKNENINSLIELKNNLFAAAGNAFMCHSDLLESCIFDDMQTVKNIIAMKRKNNRKEGRQ